MITADHKLELFERFIQDETLPKFDVKRERRQLELKKSLDRLQSTEELIEDFGFDAMSEDEFDQSTQFRSFQGTALTIQKVAKPKTWFAKVTQWLCWWKPKEREQPMLTVQEFFTSLKNSAEELVIINERAAGYERAIVNAKMASQHALLEQLRAGLLATQREVQLMSLGLTKYLTEETVVKFCKMSPRGLRLDWVGNFARHIPVEIIAKKGRADVLGIFDNYAVLHYDPKGKAYAETAKEKEAKRDPILFGVIKNRRILYYIGDWIDEYCDLTLDKLADEMLKAEMPAPITGIVHEKPTSVIKTIKTPGMP